MGRLIRGPARLQRSLSRNIAVFHALQVITGFFIWAPVWILCLTESCWLSLALGWFGCCGAGIPLGLLWARAQRNAAA